ncbi:MAG: EFR1 family ferrodoxin [Deltaproteobacteria bacterium]|nr:EFR1 family ferrodoxin [Deltaproteobacteria bacterium]
MNVDLKYFSGTGNSYKILDTCKDIFIQNGCNTTLSSIIDKPDINEESDLIGFCFPVYAFGIPRICRKYLLSLPKFENPINTFVLITAGDPDEAGFSVNESTKILKKKGVNVTYDEVIYMPSNWTVSMSPPSKKEAQLIIDSGVKKAKKIAQDILNGIPHHHVFNYPSRYSKIGFYKDYYVFKWLGVSNLWRDFRTDGTCDSCGLCAKLCLTESIQIVNEKPEWANTCEQCMRCVNYCPKEAIFQKGEGSIKGKNVYYEPTFKPLKSKKHNKANAAGAKSRAAD